MATVVLEHVTVSRPQATLLDDVDLTIGDGELIGVIGASGAGKSTLLRAIAGVEPLAYGSISIAGIDVTDMAPGDRDVSMVFQTPQLLPHRDVRRNIALPLEFRHRPTDEIALRVGAETRALHIEALLARSPRDLSAGEAQLVQVARALVRLPSVLLLDEPLAGLDASLTQGMRVDLRTLQQGYGVTTLMATNDSVEAMSMPDRLVVLAAGRVVQIGTPIDVYERPANLVAAACTGRLSTVVAAVETDGVGFWLVHPAFRYRVWQPALAAHVGGSVLVGFRPHWMQPANDGQVSAIVADASPVVATTKVSLGDDPNGDEVEIASPGRGHRRGDRLSLRMEQVVLFHPLSGERLG